MKFKLVNGAGGSSCECLTCAPSAGWALYRIPIVDYGGRDVFVYVSPLSVVAMEPTRIDADEDEEDNIGNETINGTRLVTSQDVYIVPLSPEDTANRLNLELLMPEEVPANA